MIDENPIVNDEKEPVAPVETPQEPEQAPEVPVEPEGDETPLDEPLEDGDTFPRSVVEKLRRENAGYREKAKRADDLAQRLHAALTDAPGLLADSRDLPFDEAHLSDPQALQEAIQNLLGERPHLASRRPSGDIGQGVTESPSTVSLGGMLRAGAR